MASKKKDTVSVWHWIGIFIVQALPCIGFVMSVVWAFSGTNESRKNYFRAHLVCLCLGIALWVGITAAGVLPPIKQQLKAYLDHDPSLAKTDDHKHKTPRSDD